MRKPATVTPHAGHASFNDDEARWNAVAKRDPDADGCFFYSVRSTGVYCRPSCASRPARRENVAFHATASDAEQAGFRPCKRCKPDQAALAERQVALITAACRRIEQSEELPSLETLASAAGLSRFHFHRLFKAITGLTPKAYATAQRSARVRRELDTADSVTAAIYQAGFNSSGRFYASAGKTLGMTASGFRAGGRGTAIRFAVGDCSLGVILVAASASGICAILLGDDANALTEELQRRFPRATLHGGDAEFETWMATVVGFVDAPQLGLELPLDVRGTAFQQRVWQALTEVPYGSTVSYAEIARRIGAPRAMRAVAQACAANPLAVAIPCHRVVRTDGGLSGYRWGVERKRALLRRESAP